MVRHRGRAPRRKDSCQVQPRVEGLEGRLLLHAANGGLWAKPARLTFSFAPDGTNIGGDSSNLFATMASRGFSTATWQAQFIKAAAVWQGVTNINFSQVSDDGSAFGVYGNQESDSRFGDLRIGGDALAVGVLAAAFLPPPLNGGTLAGDIVMSSNVTWQINSDYDLETVAIHEIGHALGMDHSAISTADMYAYYNGMKQTLATDDVQGAQALYGVRSSDAYDAAANNNTSGTATVITSLLDADGKASIGGLDVTLATDTDYYKVVAPANTNGTLNVSMQAAGLSLLSPKVTVFNASMVSLGSAGTANSYGSTATVATITGVTPGQVFYIKCLPANSGPGGNGAYGLLVSFGSVSASPVSPPDTTVAWRADSGGGSSGLVTNPGGGKGHHHANTLKGDHDELLARAPARNSRHPLGPKLPSHGTRPRVASHGTLAGHSARRWS